ncbi:MAG: hypothetical protein HY393_00290 [Candidatus Diapherotrites archaeon]|nr:hypothetical protein [Candidatus Diapherotrites archaeon]
MEAQKVIERACRPLNARALFEALHARGWVCTWEVFLRAFPKAMEMYEVMGKEREHVGMRVLLVAEEVGWNMGLPEAARMEEMLVLKNAGLANR